MPSSPDTQEIKPKLKHEPSPDGDTPAKKPKDTKSSKPRASSNRWTAAEDAHLVEIVNALVEEHLTSQRIPNDPLLANRGVWQIKRRWKTIAKGLAPNAKGSK